MHFKGEAHDLVEYVVDPVPNPKPELVRLDMDVRSAILQRLK